MNHGQPVVEEVYRPTGQREAQLSFFEILEQLLERGRRSVSTLPDVQRI